jgi:hypothetical protein
MTDQSSVEHRLIVAEAIVAQMVEKAAEFCLREYCSVPCLPTESHYRNAEDRIRRDCVALYGQQVAIDGWGAFVKRKGWKR